MKGENLGSLSGNLVHFWALRWPSRIINYCHSVDVYLANLQGMFPLVIEEKDSKFLQNFSNFY